MDNELRPQEKQNEVTVSVETNAQRKTWAKPIIALLIIVLVISTFLNYYYFRVASSKSQQLSALSLDQMEKQKSNPQVDQTEVPQTTYFEVDQSPLIRAYDKVFFVDTKYGYRFDFTTQPQVTLTNLDFDEVYEFEMYPKTAESSSIARFGISEPKATNGLSLLEFARNEYGYTVGTNQFGGGETDSAQETTIGSFPAITWHSTSNLEGASNYQHYLVDIGQKYVHISLYSWTDNDFEKARADLEKILKTFYFVPEEAE